MRRVVITGIGALTPIGNSREAFRKALFEGVSGAAEVTKFDPALFKTKFACEVKGLDMSEHLDRREIRRIDPYSQYALIVAEEAMVHSGIDLEKIDPLRSGVIWGTGIGGFKTMEAEIEAQTLRGGEPKYSPFLIPKLIVDIAPGHISMKYGFQGPNYTTVSACASSTNAIIAAVDAIKLDRADVIITGGSEASVTKAGLGGFMSMKALSARNDDPATASRPFDKDRDGFVMGEGAGALIVEELEYAKARGANILAEIVGTGLTADAYHITAPHPEGVGAMNVMKFALRDAKMSGEEIDYINVHGTSTPLGDIAESKAILKVFGQYAYDLNISSTKSMTGHLLGAAGAAEAIAGVFAIQANAVPPTINHFEDDPDIDSNLNFTFNTTQERKVDAIISNTFGFGGHNASVVLKRYDG